VKYDSKVFFFHTGVSLCAVTGGEFCNLLLKDELRVIGVDECIEDT
jgi:hypothetical protein